MIFGQKEIKEKLMEILRLQCDDLSMRIEVRFVNCSLRAWIDICSYFYKFSLDSKNLEEMEAKLNFAFQKYT